MSNLSSGFPDIVGRADPAAAGRVSAAAGGKDRKADVRKACAEFESLFLNYMLKEMRKTVPKDGLVSGGRAESIYTSLMDMHLSREIATRRSVGLADDFERDLARTAAAEEAADPSASADDTNSRMERGVR